MDNPFLHAAVPMYPLLDDAGYSSLQQHAQQQDLVGRTVWNGVAVDYLGVKGATITYGAVLPPVTADGVVVSDHAFPMIQVQLPFVTASELV